MSQYSHLSTPDPEFAAIVASADHPPKNLEQLDIKVVREFFNNDVMNRARTTWGDRLPADSGYRVKDHVVSVDGATITIRSIVPTPKSGKITSFPLLYWMHFGGWQVGSIDMEDYLLRIISVELQVSVCNVEYRLAPEHQFPTGLNDAYAGLKWAADNTSILSVDLAKGFIVGGASAGAQFTTVLTHRARDDPFFSARKPTGQVLQCPCLIHPEVVPEKYKSELLSMEQNAKAIGISKELVYEFYERYGAPLDDPECSSLLYTSHRDLPPAFIQVAGLDPLRDDGLLYGRLLKESSVPTKIEVYPGVPHMFPFWFPSIGQAKKWEEDLKNGLHWLLYKNK